MALAATEIVLRRHVIPFDGFEHARARFQAGDALVAAFGDSRVESGFVAAADHASFGTRGDSLQTILGKAVAWHADHPSSRLVIGLDPQQFSRERLTSDQGALLDDFVSPSTSPLAILRPYHRRYLMEYAEAVLSDPALLWRSPDASRSGESGDQALFADMPASAQQQEARIRSTHHAPMEGFSNSALAHDLRAEIAALLASGAQLCLVTMPVSSAYRSVAQDEPGFAAVRAFYAELAGEVGVRYLDLWSTYPDALFRDPDHLLPRGAGEVSTDIVAGCFEPR